MFDMKKKVVIVFLICAILFLTSCSAIDTSFITNWFGGSSPIMGKGIKIEFTEYPKGELTDQEPFRLKVKATNYGKGAVKGVLCVEDSPSQSFEGIPSNSCKSLVLQPAESISGNKLNAYIDTFQFPLDGSTYQYNNLPREIKENSIITASFRYFVESKSTAPLCLKSMNADVKTIPVPCDDTQDLTSIDQPDYPLKISKIEKTFSPLSPEQGLLKLRIYVGKVEDGEVLDGNTVFSNIISLKPVVALKPEILGDATQFDCKGLTNNQFELKDQNEKIINCLATINMDQGGYIYKTLVVNMAYGFRQSIKLPSAITLVSREDLATA